MNEKDKYRMAMRFMALCLTAAFTMACASLGPFPLPGNPAIFSGGTVISALGALGRVESAPQGPLYTGDGGSSIRLAVFAPEIQGDVPDYLPLYIQGLLNNNFSRFSAINLIDRQNLDRIISEQDMAAGGRFSDQDFVTIGNLTNTQYFLFGTIQRLSGERYVLQLSITDSGTGIRRADFMRSGSLEQLESGTLINEAAADLLTRMGVMLTDAGWQTLLAGNTSVARAEAGLARGISAQSGGDEVEALFNITQAITFDPSNLEAISRLSALSSDISGGTVSQRIVTDIQARNRWLQVFRDTTRFFNDHAPFEITFDPNLVQVGLTDYARNTATIGMHIALDPSEAGFGALNTLLEGLEKTGRRDIWGFSGWPLLDITPRTTEAVVFGGQTSFSYTVDVELINEINKTLGRGSITLNTETIRFNPGDTRIRPPTGNVGTIRFPNVRADDLTPTLIIVITAVNGISSRELNASGYMRIDTGDLEKRVQEWETATRQAQTQQEMEAAARQAQAQAQQSQREREAAARQAQTQAKWRQGLAQWSSLWFKSRFIGYNYVPEQPMGFSAGTLGLHASLNIPVKLTDSDFKIGRGPTEITAGLSIPIIRSLRIPVGAGMFSRNMENGFDTTVFETGLRFFFAELFYISGTYRMRFGDYEKNAFSFGAGFGGYS